MRSGPDAEARSISTRARRSRRSPNPRTGSVRTSPCAGREAEAARGGLRGARKTPRAATRVIATDADGDLRGVLARGGAAVRLGRRRRRRPQRVAPVRRRRRGRSCCRSSRARACASAASTPAPCMARHDGTRFDARLSRAPPARGTATRPSGFLLVVQDVTRAGPASKASCAPPRAARAAILEGLPTASRSSAGTDRAREPGAAELLDVAERDAAAGFAARPHRAPQRRARRAGRARAARGRGRAVRRSSRRDACATRRRRPRRGPPRRGSPTPHDGRPAVLVAAARRNRGRAARPRRWRPGERVSTPLLDAWDDGGPARRGGAAGARVRLANRAFLDALRASTRADVAGAAEGDLLRALARPGRRSATAAAASARGRGRRAGDRSRRRRRADPARVVPPRRADRDGARPRAGCLRVRDVTAASARASSEAARQECRRRRAALPRARAARRRSTARRSEAERLNAELRTPRRDEVRPARQRLPRAADAARLDPRLHRDDPQGAARADQRRAEEGAGPLARRTSTG